MKAPSPMTWISWLASTMIAALTMSAYVFSSFETKLDSKERRDSLEKRLDRIEDKLDSVLKQK